MPRRPKEPPVGYMLRAFEVVSYQLADTTLAEETPEIGFNASMNYLVSDDLSSVTVRARVRMYEKEKVETPLSEIVTLTTFGVIDLDKYVKEGKLHAPATFAQNIANIAVSTTRGALYSKHAASKYATILMPLFNSEGLIPNVPWNIPVKQQLELQPNA